MCLQALEGDYQDRLYDTLYEDTGMYADKTGENPEYTDEQRVIEALKESPKPVKYLQMLTGYSSRGHFLKDVINPLLEAGTIYRDGNAKSPTARLHLR